MAEDKDTDKKQMDWGNIAKIADSVLTNSTTLVGYLNPKTRDAQVQIAQANAQAAQANSTPEPKTTFGINNKYLLIGGGIFALIVILLIFKKRQQS